MPLDILPYPEVPSADPEFHLFSTKLIGTKFNTEIYVMKAQICFLFPAVWRVMPFLHFNLVQLQSTYKRHLPFMNAAPPHTCAGTERAEMALLAVVPAFCVYEHRPAEHMFMAVKLLRHSYTHKEINVSYEQRPSGA